MRRGTVNADEVAILPSIESLRPIRFPSRKQLSNHSDLVVWHIDVEFEEWRPSDAVAARWTDSRLDAQETWRKRPLAKGRDSGCPYSCGEVELAARLRGAGFEAFWVSEWAGFPHVDCWRPFCVKRPELRTRLPEVWEFDQRLRSRATSASNGLGKSGGHADIVAWRAGEGGFVFLEFKGPGDTIRAKQDTWRAPRSSMEAQK